MQSSTCAYVVVSDQALVARTACIDGDTEEVELMSCNTRKP